VSQLGYITLYHLVIWLLVKRIINKGKKNYFNIFYPILFLLSNRI